MCLPLIKFGAELLVGTASGCDATFAFEQVDDPTIGERLVLVIDGDVDAKEFKLQIRQVPRGAAQQETAAPRSEPQ